MARVNAKRKAVAHRRHHHKPAARKPQTSIVIAKSPIQPWVLAPDEITILKNAICKGATDEEMKFCLTVARRYRLDPFQQQIWFIKRWDSAAIRSDGKSGSYIWTPQVALNGLLHLAARDHKDYGTYGEPSYGPMIEVEYRKNGEGAARKLKVPEWARIEARKKGCTEPTVAKLWWEEIYQNIDFSPMVRQMPRLMLAKCAKANATRTAYPSTGGLLIPEETQGREYTQFTPEGRIVYREEPAVNPHLPMASQSVEEYERREAEEIAKLPKEAQDRIAKQRERSRAVEQKIEESKLDHLYYQPLAGTDNFEINGSLKLKKENRELLVPFYMATLDKIIINPTQLGHLIAELERRKVPIRAKDREPGVDG
jgi:RecT family